MTTHWSVVLAAQGRSAAAQEALETLCRSYWRPLYWFVRREGSAKVIVRGLGPSLTRAGVSGALQDPTLELHDGSGAVVAANDNWKETQQSEIEATTIPPTDDRESAIVADLTPGPDTVILRGKGNTTGIGLVETYALQ